MWENILQQGRPQITIWRIRIACWITKATDTQTHSEYVTLIAYALLQLLHERPPMLRYTHTTLSVLYVIQVNAGLQQMKAIVVVVLGAAPCVTLFLLLSAQNISSLVTGMLRN
jgi:hypothetical protein